MSEQTRQLAERIARDLFTGYHVNGWTEAGLMIRVEKHLRHAAGASVPQEAETCICAAIQLPDGELFRGHRHDDALAVAGKGNVSRNEIINAVQGFITSRNRFVTREEGAALQRAAGIPSAHTCMEVNDMLFSEDLYLRETKGQNRPRLTGEASSAPQDG